MREYDQIAEWYARSRDPTIGVAEVVAFVSTLPAGVRVLDLGCGDGLPITQALVQEGLDVTALDSSAEMVRRFRANLPGVSVRHERAEDADFPRGSFEAVVAWGVLFHLSETAQAGLISKVSEWLGPGGAFFFTSGDAAGERKGAMDGVPLRYVSLGPKGYRRLLESAGMRLVRHYSGAGGNHTYVAVQRPRPAVASERGVPS